MERRFQCPSCGASNLVTNPGVLMKICDFCKTAIYWDKESALKAGAKSLDLPQSPRFKTGGIGKLQGRPFTILGRLTYKHESGFWHEWYVEFDDKTIVWLTEDEGELFVENPLDIKTALPPLESLSPGMQISLNDKIGVVEEIGQARCIGGEGQIPILVEIGETYPYVDGASPDGKNSFGLEYDSSGTPQVFWGKIVNLKGAKAKAYDKAAPESKYGETIHCPNCGKPYEGKRVDSTKMVVCAACGSALELEAAQAKVVGVNEGPEPKFTFSVGTKMTFDGVSYEVMGRMLYVQKEGGLEYRTFEYVLYNPDSGYLRLSEEKGHFLLGNVSHVHFTWPVNPTRKQKITIGGETFRWYEGGTVTLNWVDGALPWRAVVGETTRFNHIIKPPEFVDYEITGTEAEMFRGRYLSSAEMEAAVGEFIPLPRPAAAVNSCQPYEASKWVAGTWKIGVVFLVINVILGLYSCASDRRKLIMRESIDAENYTKEYLSQPFKLDSNRSILRLTSKAPVHNSWIALDFGIVNAEDKVVSELGGEISVL